MKLNRFFALAALAASPAFATPFTIDFEKTWNYANGDVNGYYNGGTAADGITGANLGVSFVGVSGLSNDPSFTYYSGAPSMQGTAYAYTTAFMNVAGGVVNALSFYYSVLDAVKAYSGPDGTGSLLGSFNLTANNSGGYDTWTPVTFTFNGTAQSFDLTASANAVGLDNISAVPEPGSLALMLAGCAPLLSRAAGAIIAKRSSPLSAFLAISRQVRLSQSHHSGDRERLQYQYLPGCQSNRGDHHRAGSQHRTGRPKPRYGNGRRKTGGGSDRRCHAGSHVHRGRSAARKSPIPKKVCRSATSWILSSCRWQAR